MSYVICMLLFTLLINNKIYVLEKDVYLNMCVAVNRGEQLMCQMKNTVRQGCINSPGGPWALELKSPKQLLFYSDDVTLLSGGNLVTHILTHMLCFGHITFLTESINIYI